ncbi:unnamed protein product [Ilex paraguariensis]|uniref:Uncharacterized protein n=1 Tax=Ilex paraguariensis TaxID=185542 RepID=A0ABC8SGJ0_9AQUA
MPPTLSLNPQTSLNLQIPPNLQNSLSDRNPSSSQIPLNVQSFQVPIVQSSLPDVYNAQIPPPCNLSGSFSSGHDELSYRKKKKEDEVVVVGKVDIPIVDRNKGEVWQTGKEKAMVQEVHKVTQRKEYRPKTVVSHGVEKRFTVLGDANEVQEQNVGAVECPGGEQCNFQNSFPVGAALVSNVPIQNEERFLEVPQVALVDLMLEIQVQFEDAMIQDSEEDNNVEVTEDLGANCEEVSSVPVLLTSSISGMNINNERECIESDGVRFFEPVNKVIGQINNDENDVALENLGECRVMLSPSKGSSFIVDHQFNVRKDYDGPLDDQLGLVSERVPPNKGYYYDQGSSHSMGSDNSVNEVDEGTRLISSGKFPSINV